MSEQKITAPGIYPGFPIADYHADPCPEPSLSSSIAKLLLNRSPLHAKVNHPRLNTEIEPEEYDPKRALGTALHALVLGRGGEVLDVVQGFDDWKRKEAREMRDAAIAAGRVPILEHVFERAEVIAAAASAQLSLPLGFEGHGDAEVAMFARDGDTWLRALADWLVIDEKNASAQVIDYKSTKASAAPHSVARLVAEMGYDVQAAFYERVLARIRPDLEGRIAFCFVVQEVEAPFALTEIELTEADMAVARRKVGAAVERWERCLRTNEWPGYPSGVQTIVLPDWSSRAWTERELAAEFDESGRSDWMFAGR